MQPESQLRLCTAKPWANPNLLLETFLCCKSWECLTVQWPQHLLWNNTAQNTAASRAGGSIVSAYLMPLQRFHLFRSYTSLFGKVEVEVNLAFCSKGFPSPHRKVKCTHSSTAWLKLFLIVHLWRGKQTAIDIVSTPIFPSEGPGVQSPCCLLCLLLFWIQYECPRCTLRGGEHTTGGQEVILGLTVCLDMGTLLSLCEALGGWSVLGLSYRRWEGVGVAQADICSEGLTAASLPAVWGALCTGEGFSGCISVSPSKECCHLKSLLRVSCCWAFSATFSRVCPSIKSVTALCLGRISLGYVTQKCSDNVGCLNPLAPVHH